MAGIIDGYNALHKTLMTMAESLGSSEVLIPIVSVVGIIAVLVLLVRLDGDPGGHVERLLTALIPSFAVFPLLVLYVWLANGGFDSMMDLAEPTPDGNVLVVFVSFILQLGLILAGALMGLTYALVMLVILAVIGYSVVRASPDLVMVAFLALRPVLRGVWVILRLPFVGARELFYLFTQPPTLRAMKRATRKKTATPDDLMSAAQGIGREFREVHRAPPGHAANAVIRGMAENYRRFAKKLSLGRARALSEYNRSVSGVTDEVRKRYEDAYDQSGDKHGKN